MAVHGKKVNVITADSSYRQAQSHFAFLSPMSLRRNIFFLCIVALLRLLWLTLSPPANSKFGHKEKMPVGEETFEWVGNRGTGVAEVVLEKDGCVEIMGFLSDSPLKDAEAEQVNTACSLDKVREGVTDFKYRMAGPGKDGDADKYVGRKLKDKSWVKAKFCEPNSEGKARYHACFAEGQKLTHKEWTEEEIGKELHTETRRRTMQMSMEEPFETEQILNDSLKKQQSGTSPTAHSQPPVIAEPSGEKAKPASVDKLAEEATKSEATACSPQAKVNTSPVITQAQEGHGGCGPCTVS